MTLTLSASALSANDEWLTDHAQALEKAKKEKKVILMDFTGSDWCGWCVKLEKEVFSQKEFIDYAKEHLVLLTVDFPRGKDLESHVKAQNNKLQQQYKIEGFPTIVVLNSDGKEIGRLGYMRGGPSAFIAELKKLKSS